MLLALPVYRFRGYARPAQTRQSKHANLLCIENPVKYFFQKSFSWVRFVRSSQKRALFLTSPKSHLVNYGMNNENLTVGKVKEWHDPRNEDCRQNQDVSQDCNCKRPVVRKPYRTIRITDYNVRHNVNPKLVMEVYPNNGTITMREHGRRKRFSCTAADIYHLTMRWAANAEKALRRKDRAEKRKNKRRRVVTRCASLST